MKKMDKHRQFEEDLVSYLMDELTQSQREATEAHLVECAACCLLLEEYRQTLELPDALPEIEPPADFTQRIMAAARAAREQLEAHENQLEHAPEFLDLATTGPAPTRRMRYTLARFVAYAAAVVILIIATTRTLDDSPGESRTGYDSVGSETVAQNQQDSTDGFRFTWPETPYVMAELEPPFITGFDIELPPLAFTEPLIQAPPPHTWSHPREFTVRRVEAANPVYARRTDWRAKQQALHSAAADIAAINAITRGLWWLARHQDSDGRWSATEFTQHCGPKHQCTSPAPSTIALSDEAVTAAALLAMLGDGHTPGSGRFQANVSRGLAWLISRQNQDGSFGTANAVIEQSLATAALAEAYGMTGEVRYRMAAQRAVNHLLTQEVALLDNADRVRHGNFPAAALRVFALGAAGTARLDVPRDTIPTIVALCARVEQTAPTAFTSPYEATTVARLTPGMIALIAPGDPPSQSLLLSTVGRLRTMPPDWSANGQLHWFTGSTIMHKAGGEAWLTWNANLRATLVNNQEGSGHAIGSWAPRDDHTRAGGRVFATAMSILSLETPYR